MIYFRKWRLVSRELFSFAFLFTMTAYHSIHYTLYIKLNFIYYDLYLITEDGAMEVRNFKNPK